MQIYFDDSMRNVAGGTAGGMRSVLVGRGGYDAASPNMRVQTITDIATLPELAWLWQDLTRPQPTANGSPHPIANGVAHVQTGVQKLKLCSDGAASVHSPPLSPVHSPNAITAGGNRRCSADGDRAMAGMGIRRGHERTNGAERLIRVGSS